MKKSNLNKIKSTGFKLPDDYLDSFEEQVLGKIHDKPKLDAIETSGFKKPENYFDSLEERIAQKLSNQKETKVITLNAKRTLVYLSGIAAAILVLFNLAIFDSKPSFDDLETETVENYLLDESITSYEIAGLLSDEQIEEVIILDHNLSEDHIETYLLDNADIETLMIE
ncbi:hypothetical protein [uncultured Algibacter sp.]|uniref:hypothetical protein n=1 Tax=uncultured Algibacter sp. TaxID=298659 RepID=UPI00261C1DC6|nr:hypothetical protein [uncultured Algibacter sp.]